VRHRYPFEALHWLRQKRVDQQAAVVSERAARTAQAKRDEAGAEARCPQAEGGVAPIEPSIEGTGRIGRPMRRAQPLHPSALLVDQHRDVVPPANRSEFVSQRVDLGGIDDVALEQDEAPRRGRADERPLVGRDRRARQSRDECPWRHGAA